MSIDQSGKSNLCVFEPDSFTGDMYRRVFSQWFSVQLFDRLNHLTETIGHPRWDVILLSFDSGNCDGVDIVVRVKRASVPGVPIVVAIGDNSAKLERLIRREGVYFYALKPVEIQEMIAVLLAAQKQKTICMR